MVYEGKLFADPSTDEQRLIPSRTNKIITLEFGIIDCPVEHEGNTQSSQEEIQQIHLILKELLKSSYRSKDGSIRKLSVSDILIVAPYNYQVNQMIDTFGTKYRIGTVDKFQGQEAPVVILSMCASDPSEAPRGTSFLFDRNRLNVAISRAQALAVIVRAKSLDLCRAKNLEEQKAIGTFFRFLGR